MDTTRRFTIAYVDFLSLMRLPRLLPAFQRRLPRAGLRIVSIEHMIESKRLGSGEIDLLVGIPPVAPRGCAHEDVFEEQMVCVVRKERGRKRPMTLTRFLETPHVEMAVFGREVGPIDAALSRMGRERRVALSVPHFASAPRVVAVTDMLMTLPRRLAEIFAAELPLQIHPVPLKLPPLRIRQYWPSHTGEDAGTTLLRQLVRGAAGGRRRR